MKGSYHRRKAVNKNAKIRVPAYNAFTFERQMIIDALQTAFEAGFAHAQENSGIIDNFGEQFLIRIIAGNETSEPK